MSLWRRQTDRIKREVSAQDFGWFIGGGLAARQLKAAIVLLLPALAAILFLKDGSLKQLLAGALAGAWFLNGIILYVLGTAFWAKKMDRYHDRKVRPNLSKEYRKP
jgi:hypothetical protein